jgi:hypothetical protein
MNALYSETENFGLIVVLIITFPYSSERYFRMNHYFIRLVSYRNTVAIYCLFDRSAMSEPSIEASWMPPSNGRHLKLYYGLDQMLL